MKKYLLILTGVLAFAATPALAGEVIYYPPSVTGKKARKQIRRMLFIENLERDKKAVYDAYGYTPHRIRINAAGKMTERWTYHEEGLQFTFDKESNLIEERKVKVERRRDWVYQK
jgi:hypothetical protein